MRVGFVAHVAAGLLEYLVYTTLKIAAPSTNASDKHGVFSPAVIHLQVYYQYNALLGEKTNIVRGLVVLLKEGIIAPKLYYEQNWICTSIKPNSHTQE